MQGNCCNEDGNHTQFCLLVENQKTEQNKKQYNRTVMHCINSDVDEKLQHEKLTKLTASHIVS